MFCCYGIFLRKYSNMSSVQSGLGKTKQRWSFTLYSMSHFTTRGKHIPTLLAFSWLIMLAVAGENDIDKKIRAKKCKMSGGVFIKHIMSVQLT